MATKCIAPTTFITVGRVGGYVPSPVVLQWSGAAGGTSNAITGYEIRYGWDSSPLTESDTPPGGWQSIVRSTSATEGEFTFSSAMLNRGKYYVWQIRTRGAAGATYYSDWKSLSPYCQKINQLIESVPAIECPQASKQTYNSRPRILLTTGADPDTDQVQTVSATGWSASHTAKASADVQKIVMRKDADATAGALSVEITQNDTLESVSSTVETEYVPAVYTDTLTAGTTRIKAVHMNELRTMIDTVRDYYELAAYSWADTITAQVTSMADWATHVGEMRMAIEEIAAVVNAWDTTSAANRIVLPTWITIVGKQPTAAVMQQIRDIIPAL